MPPTFFDGTVEGVALRPAFAEFVAGESIAIAMRPSDCNETEYFRTLARRSARTRHSILCSISPARRLDDRGLRAGQPGGRLRFDCARPNDRGSSPKPGTHFAVVCLLGCSRDARNRRAGSLVAADRADVRSGRALAQIDLAMWRIQCWYAIAGCRSRRGGQSRVVRSARFRQRT